MNKEEKKKHDSEISNKFIARLDYEDGELDNLSIQDMCVLIGNAKYARNNNMFINAEENMTKLIKKFYAKLVYKVKDAKILYTIIDNNTSYPFIDENAQNCIWLFSEKQYAEEAVDYYMQQYRSFKCVEVNRNNINELYEELYLNGINGVYIDNGYAGCVIKKQDLLEEPNYENTPYINIPITNPNFMLAHLKMCQEICWKVNYEKREEVLDRLELDVSKEIIKTKFLVPTKGFNTSINNSGEVVLSEDTIIKIPTITGSDGIETMPIFTDWKQFRRVYSQDEYKGLIITFEDVEQLINSKQYKAAVINVGKFPFVLNEKNLNRIKRVLGQVTI